MPSLVTVSFMQYIAMKWKKGGRGLTNHDNVESITDVTLVASEVNTAVPDGTLLLLVFADFRTEGDTTTEDDAGVFLSWFLIRLLVAVILYADSFHLSIHWLCELSNDGVLLCSNVGLVVGPRARLASVGGKGAAQHALFGSVVEVVSECKGLVVDIGGQSDRGSCSILACFHNNIDMQYAPLFHRPIM